MWHFQVRRDQLPPRCSSIGSNRRSWPEKEPNPIGGVVTIGPTELCCEAGGNWMWTWSWSWLLEESQNDHTVRQTYEWKVRYISFHPSTFLTEHVRFCEFEHVNSNNHMNFVQWLQVVARICRLQSLNLFVKTAFEFKFTRLTRIYIKVINCSNK